MVVYYCLLRLKKLLGRTETRTRDRMYCQTIRSVRDISRDDRARIATCSLRTLTDRLKANYSIDVRCYSDYRIIAENYFLETINRHYKIQIISSALEM